MAQRIILPWDTRKWDQIVDKLTTPPKSIVDMDTRMVGLHSGSLRTRMLIDVFNIYYSDSRYEQDRVTQEDLAEKVFPTLCKLVLSGPKVFSGLHLRILTGASGGPMEIATSSLYIPKPAVAVLLACAWFDIFDYACIARGPVKMDQFDPFSYINVFEKQNIFALQCLLTYFMRVHQYLTAPHEDRDHYNASQIVLTRSRLVKPPDWSSLDAAISEVEIGTGDIDNSAPKLHLVSCDEFIGGSFGNVMTRMEIVFMMRPEAFVATLLCPRLAFDEALLVIGAEKYSKACGYGSNVRFCGVHNDDTLYGYNSTSTETILQKALICIDATKNTGASQYLDQFERDLNKAYLGFNTLSIPDTSGKFIATGNWSCNVFGGNMQLKFVQQLLAASATGKTLIYHPFTADFEREIDEFMRWIEDNHMTVANLYNIYYYIINECPKGPYSRLSSINLFNSMMDIL